MENLALKVTIGGALASSFSSSLSASTKSIFKMSSQIKELNKTKISIKRFKELQKDTQGNRKEFVKLGRSLKEAGYDLSNFSNKTKELNKNLLNLKKNAIIKSKIELEKNKIFEQRDSLLATIGSGFALGGVVNLQSQLLQAQGELASLNVDDNGIAKITDEAKNFTNQFAGTTTPEFIKASYDIKSGIASLSDSAVGKFTSLAAMTAGATKSTTTQMTSFFATGYGIYNKQFRKFATTAIDGFNNLSEEEKDIKFGEVFASGIAAAVQKFKTNGQEMQGAIENLGAAATTSNVSFSEQLAILGSMQKSFASGSEAATAYKGFLEGAVGAQEDLNLKFVDQNNQLLSAPVILEKLRKKYGETLDDMEKQEIKKAFGTEEGMKFITSFYDEIDTLKVSISEMDKEVVGGTLNLEKMMNATQRGKGLELLGQQIQNLGASIGKMFYPAVELLGSGIGALAVGLDKLITAFPATSSVIGGAIVLLFGLVVVTKTAVIATSLFKIANLSLRGSILGSLRVVKFLRLGLNRLALSTKIATVATRIFNFALRANPIGLVVTAIGALVGGLIWAYNKFDWFKNGVNGVWEFIKTVFSYSPLGIIMENYGKIFDWLGSKFEWFGNTVSKIKGLGESVKKFFGLGGDEKSSVVKKVIATTAATTQLATAQPNYVDIKKPDYKRPESINQTNHIKIIVNNPASTVDMEKAIVNGMKKAKADKGLSDEDI